MSGILSVFLNKLRSIYDFLPKSSLFNNSNFKNLFINKIKKIFNADSDFLIFFKVKKLITKFFFKKFLIYRFKNLKSKLVLQKYTKLFKLSYFYYFTTTKKYTKYSAIKNIKFDSILLILLFFYKKTLGDGFIYLRGLFLFFFFDACFTDDEPI